MKEKENYLFGRKNFFFYRQFKLLFPAKFKHEALSQSMTLK